MNSYIKEESKDSEDENKKDDSSSKQINKITAEHEGASFSATNFELDIEITCDELIEQTEQNYTSIFDLYDMIHFSIFTTQITLNLRYEELNTDFVKPLREFMHSKADMMLRNQQILMSKYLLKIMMYIQAFLNAFQNRSPEFGGFLKNSNIMRTIGVVLN